MEPTEKQLNDLFSTIDYREGVSLGERMLRAWKFVERETGNATYLSQAHRLCSDMGIAPGHIEDRLFEAFGALVRLQNIEYAALACDGIDMGRFAEVPIEAWDDLQKALRGEPDTEIKAAGE